MMFKIITKILDKIRSIKYGIINSIKWFRIIWNDRDWDHWFLYEILRFKLIRMEEYFRKYGMASSSKKDAINIKKCILILDRLIEDEYFLHTYLNHNKKWGEPKFTFGNVDEKMSRLIIKRNNVISEKDKVQERKEFLQCSQQEDYLIKQDIDYLFNILKKHIRCWWD